jgi:nucleoside-diphosphate-sugar epimerase
MEYFVTGATGFLGGRLVAQLVEAGPDVVALVRDPARASDLPEGVSLVEGDVTRKESMREAMAGVDGVFHLAAWYRVGVHDPGRARRVNVGGTRNVLELVRDLDVPKAVYTSSLAVFSDTGGRVVDESYRFSGDHLSVYDRTKWAAHYEVAEPMMAAGLPLVVVMPGAVYGPGDRGPTWLLWEAYLRGRLPVVPRETGYCWGHVDDVADAHWRAMDRGDPGEAYIVGGDPTTLVETFDVAAAATGIGAPRAVTPALFRALSRVAGLLERVVSLPPMYAAESLRVLGGVTYWGDNAKARRELGVEHRPLAAGLGGTLRYELARPDG